ncbi:MAG: 4Fe-4S dicluster domain-containing protein [Chitinispirillaceae bacterium]|nr:4Fe-4S dicluster domain-containing protein [Chitinispirillaceae bacterium]
MSRQDQPPEKRIRNFVTIAREECKGCHLCVKSCPRGCIVIGSNFNRVGYQYAEFKSDGCLACGICYYVCPEPNGITVHSKKKKAAENE